MKIKCPVAENAAAMPDQTAISAQNFSINYRDFHSASGHLCAKLSSLGIRRGDGVGILAANSPQYILLLCALWRLGAVAVPLNTRLPDESLKSQLNTIDCRNIFVDGDAGRLNSLDIENIFTFDDHVTFERKEGDVSDCDIDPDQAATIIFTSGSAGRSKAVRARYANHYYNARASNKNIPLENSDAWLVSLPLYHVAGLAVIFRSFIAGTTIACPSPGESIQKNLADKHITHLSLIQAQALELFDDADFIKHAGALKAVLIGGSSISGKVFRLAKEKRLPLYMTYGMTETASQIATSPAVCYDRSVGLKPLAHARVRIETDGEIAVSGDVLFEGYQERGKLRRPFDGEGWFLTGDAGKLDRKGMLHVTGRKDNMFVSGGENIYPEAIERELSRIDWIRQSAVIGVRHKQYGYRPVAFIDLDEKEGAFDGEYLIRTLSQHLPKYMLPDYFLKWFVTDQKSGIKIDRSALKDIAAGALTGSGAGMILLERTRQN